MIGIKVLIPLATGFEEIEAVTNIDVLRRVNIEAITASLDNKIVKGAHNIEFNTDCNISEVKIDELDGIILPGGMPGSSNLKNNKEVISIIKELNKNKKLLAAICAAPIVLEEAGVISDKNITSYPGFEKQFMNSNYLNNRIVLDENIITGRGPGASLEFALAVVDYLLGEKVVSELKESMIVNL